MNADQQTLTLNRTYIEPDPVLKTLEAKTSAALTAMSAAENAYQTAQQLRRADKETGPKPREIAAAQQEAAEARAAYYKALEEWDKVRHMKARFTVKAHRMTRTPNQTPGGPDLITYTLAPDLDDLTPVTMEESRAKAEALRRKHPEALFQITYNPFIN